MCVHATNSLENMIANREPPPESPYQISRNRYSLSFIRQKNKHQSNGPEREPPNAKEVLLDRIRMFRKQAAQQPFANAKSQVATHMFINEARCLRNAAPESRGSANMSGMRTEWPEFAPAASSAPDRAGSMPSSFGTAAAAASHASEKAITRHARSEVRSRRCSIHEREYNFPGRG